MTNDDPGDSPRPSSPFGPSFTQYATALSNWLDPFLIGAHVNVIREDYASGMELVHCADHVADVLLNAYEPGSKVWEAARLRDLCDLPPIEAADCEWPSDE